MSFRSRTSKLLSSTFKRIKSTPIYNITHLKYSLLLISGFTFGSTLHQKHSNKILCQQNTTYNEHIPNYNITSTNFLNDLDNIKKSIDEKILLKNIKICLTSQNLNNQTFVKCFIIAGMENTFNNRQTIIDLYNILNEFENKNIIISCLMSLFSKGNTVEKYKYFFECIDIYDIHEINIQIFKKVLIELIKLHYYLKSINKSLSMSDTEILRKHQTLKNEIEYYDIECQVSLKLLNSFIYDVFDFADLNRDGYLRKKDFIRWAKMYKEYKTDYINFEYLFETRFNM